MGLCPFDGGFAHYTSFLLILSVPQFFLAVYKRSTVPVFKAHGLAQASIADCVTETLSAIRTVSGDI